MRTVYAIVCDDPKIWTQYDELWGDEPRVHATPEEACDAMFRTIAAGDWRLISLTGDHPDEGKHFVPVYRVVEVDPEEYLATPDVFQDAGLADALEEYLATKEVT